MPSEKEEKSNFVEDEEGETLLMEVHAKVSPGSKLFWYICEYRQL